MTIDNLKREKPITQLVKTMDDLDMVSQMNCAIRDLWHAADSSLKGSGYPDHKDTEVKIVSAIGIIFANELARIGREMHPLRTNLELLMSSSSSLFDLFY